MVVRQHLPRWCLIHRLALPTVDGNLPLRDGPSLVERRGDPKLALQDHPETVDEVVVTDHLGDQVQDRDIRGL